jgi:hypothetical protein
LEHQAVPLQAKAQKRNLPIVNHIAEYHISVLCHVRYAP